MKVLLKAMKRVRIAVVYVVVRGKFSCKEIRRSTPRNTPTSATGTTKPPPHPGAAATVSRKAYTNLRRSGSISRCRAVSSR